MSAEVPFKTAGPAKPVILVPTFVNGRGPYEFALDTGASLTVLSAELARGLGMGTGETKEGMGAGGRVQVVVSSIASLAVGSAKVENLQVAITDLRALAQAAGTRLEGIIGHNYLKVFRVTIDYPQQILRLE